MGWCGGGIQDEDMQAGIRQAMQLDCWSAASQLMKYARLLWLESVSGKSTGNKSPRQAR